MIRPTQLFLTGSLLLAGLASGCSGSSGGSGGGAIGFQLTRISLPSGAVWQINRPIEFTFSQDVDFSTVNLNTINISSNGVPATGTFSFRLFDADGDGILESVDERTIIFQPHCPTLANLADAGLAPGGVAYELVVSGRSSGTINTIRSQSGQALEETQSRSFTTPVSTSPSAAFLDTNPSGAPVPVVRGAGKTQIVDGVTYVEIGNNPDPATRIFFEFDSSTQTYSPVPGPLAPSETPLNLYSSEETSVSVVIEFNQPVDPSSTNISSDRLRLEFLDAGVWTPLETTVELVANCTSVGSRVKLTPVGLLPKGGMFRAVVLPGFRDIVGQTNQLAQDDFAVAPTEVLDYMSLNDPSKGADEFLESFDFGATSPESFQDTNVLTASPEAEWGQGELTAAFSFSGTGGPGGDFDWFVRSGETIFFDTTATAIIGGPGGVPTTIENTSGGVIDVRNLKIEVGGEVRVQGPNPVTINATGYVRIDGTLDVAGFNAKDVATLNTGNQVEVGGPGTAGGGRGGHANEVTNNSTPRGGFGQGPFGESNTGGEGGESGFAPANLGKDARRPGGGGGGRFAADQGTSAAEDGFDGATTAKDQFGNSPPMGGAAGTGPFLDGDATNDFFGVKPVVTGGVLSGLTRGELRQLWAGYGGGGGGNALPSAQFPTKRWNPGTDEKGGGGGGGGGAVRIRALGRIVFGANGTISVRGGRGATGENTNFLDHIGGSGGAGSGGHVILESATQIDFTDSPDGIQMGVNVGAAERDWVNSDGAPRTVGPTGNQGGTPVPVNISYGGAGGPGVIQLHVPDPVTPPSNDPTASDIVVPTVALGFADPLTAVSAPTALPLIPTFSAQSVAQSKWIAIGGADRAPGGGAELVQYLFAGTDPSQGKILATNGIVDTLPPLLGPEEVPSATVTLQPDEVTLRISGASLDPLINDPSPISNDIYLRTPELLRNFLLRLWVEQNQIIFQDFDVVDATYDDASVVLDVTVDGSAGTLLDFVVARPLGTTIEYQLIPRFFRVETDGVDGALPTTSCVQILFEGTGDDGLGNPDEQNILVPLTGDISEFNNQPPGALKYFRFQVLFNLDAQSLGVSSQTKPVSLEFLRIPFLF
jgi:hypothetical protein